MIADFDRCYDAMLRQDARFDGWIVVGVHSTGIYCRPSCPARPPKRDNVAFHPTAAAAQRAGLRACQRCRPDATSGSPKWQIRDDLAARAMRLIADGVLDRVGLRGLAHALGTTQRHLDRLLIEEASSSAWQLARAQRAQTARTLIESTTLPFVQVANAVGFDDVSQFQATVGQIFAATPAQLRQRARPGPTPEAGQVHLNLPVRTPFAPTEVLDYLAVRAVPGVERVEAGWLHRALHLPYGGGHVSLRPWATHVDCRLDLDDVRDVAAAVYRCRHLLDLDADPEGIAGGLGGDPVLGPLIERVPGLRSPGSFDAGEILAGRSSGSRCRSVRHGPSSDAWPAATATLSGPRGVV